jgi:hypothetical protein
VNLNNFNMPEYNNQDMDEILLNIIFTEALIKLMNQNEMYPVTIQTDYGEKRYTLLKDENDTIQIYDEGQIGIA